MRREFRLCTAGTTWSEGTSFKTSKFLKLWLRLLFRVHRCILPAPNRKGKRIHPGQVQGHNTRRSRECFCSDYSFGELVSLDSYFVIRPFGMHGRDRIFTHVATHTVVV